MHVKVHKGRASHVRRAGAKRGQSRAVPPTFHPLPSLLNVIDFESETDETVHIRKQLDALASVSNCTRSLRSGKPPLWKTVILAAT